VDKLNLSFSLLVAYVVPGLIGTWAVGLHFEPVGDLLGMGATPMATATVVPLLIATLGVGVVVNAAAWALVRPVIELTGMRRPSLDYARLEPERLEVFKTFIDAQFRYYQAYANLLVALLAAVVAHCAAARPVGPGGRAVLVVVCSILFFAARDSLKRSYVTTAQLLDNGTRKANDMTNGHPAPVPGVTPKKQPEQAAQQPADPPPTELPPAGGGTGAGADRDDSPSGDGTDD